MDCCCFFSAAANKSLQRSRTFLPEEDDDNGDEDGDDGGDDGDNDNDNDNEFGSSTNTGGGDVSKLLLIFFFLVLNPTCFCKSHSKLFLRTNIPLFCLRLLFFLQRSGKKKENSNFKKKRNKWATPLIQGNVSYLHSQYSLL